jgi:hypothetical protein
MLAVGLPMFLRLSLRLSKKIPLVGIFSLGVFVIIAAILNKIYSFSDPFSDEWVYWYVRESSTALIVANLPFVWLFYRKIFRIRSSTASRRARQIQLPGFLHCAGKASSRTSLEQERTQIRATLTWSLVGWAKLVYGLTI